MDFLEHYQHIITQQHLSEDQNQIDVVKSLRDLLTYFANQSSKRQCSHWLTCYKLPQILQQHLSKKRKPAPGGRYIWGGVGRGKSWLMALFFESVTIEKKVRINFQEFMQQIHLSLQREKGHKNPLQIIAKRFAERWQLICLDEFMVTDITDAMLLHGLLMALQDEDVTMVMTSNLAPDDLYRNGLQRDRFMPAIELIKNSMHVLELKGELDYRRKFGNSFASYFSTDDQNVEQKMRGLFQEKVGSMVELQHNLLINRRYIKAYRVSGNVVWFDFNVICGRPRSSQDYIELANRYRSLFISNIPILDDGNDDMAYRFIQLIDELYDRKIKVAISAALPPQQLYQGRQHKFEFVRTISRLEEIRQSSL